MTTDLENALDDVDFLATQSPPSRLIRFMTKFGHRSGHGKPASSTTCAYEKAYKKHRAEILARTDTLPEVKRYIERYIPK